MRSGFWQLLVCSLQAETHINEELALQVQELIALVRTILLQLYDKGNADADSGCRKE